ncbi:hypothetical protein SAMN06297251_10114 [Fulvimarina manganoxydans]|uniref:Uncharacterized protein n=2 Tax=Fulvimarina manganoxydans TaxID=937218 RepID=A0A1W1Y810_9HYPH|nr:hypothetical protein SAMN06297251_10114 [Fulvimarina manganoxydans]
MTDEQADAIMLRRFLGDFIMPAQRTRVMIELEARGLTKYDPRSCRHFLTPAGDALIRAATR